jgi:hypothetical protein
VCPRVPKRRRPKADGVCPNVPSRRRPLAGGCHVLAQQAVLAEPSEASTVRRAAPVPSTSPKRAAAAATAQTRDHAPTTNLSGTGFVAVLGVSLRPRFHSGAVLSRHRADLWSAGIRHPQPRFCLTDPRTSIRAASRLAASASTRCIAADTASFRLLASRAPRGSLVFGDPSDRTYRRQLGPKRTGMIGRPSGLRRPGVWPGRRS